MNAGRSKDGVDASRGSSLLLVSCSMHCLGRIGLKWIAITGEALVPRLLSVDEELARSRNCSEMEKKWCNKGMRWGFGCTSPIGLYSRVTTID